MKILQSEAARRLRVSTVTLSRWERDKVYPTWPVQSRVIGFLGYDPFINAELGRPKGNETSFVAILSSNEPASIGLAIREHRMELKTNRKECAKELGVDVKTLRAWEMDQQTPSHRLQERLLKFLESGQPRPKRRRITTPCPQ